MSHLAWLVPVGLIFAPTVHWLWQRWTMSVWHNSHGLFVPLMVAFLVRNVLRRDSTRQEEASAYGFLFLIPGLMLVVIDTAITTQLLSAIGLVLCLPGLSLLLLGARRTKRLTPAWILAWFMLPVPAAFAESLMLLLRKFSAVGATELLGLFGIPVLLQHTTLHLADHQLAVADACSGLSALYASITFALFLALVVTSPTRRLLVLALAVPCGIVCNIVRCTVLALIVQEWGVGLLETWLHPLSGLASFAASVSILIAVAGPIPLRKAAE